MRSFCCVFKEVGYPRTQKRSSKERTRVNGMMEDNDALINDLSSTVADDGLSITSSLSSSRASSETGTDLFVVALVDAPGGYDHTVPGRILPRSEEEEMTPSASHAEQGKCSCLFTLPFITDEFHTRLTALDQHLL